MGLLGEILCWARLHAWRKIYLGLQEPHAKAITQHKQWFEGDEVEVAGVANSQEVTTSGGEAPMGGVPTMVDTRQDQQDELLALGETQERSGCQHHWVLDTPKGPVSKGACRSCGEERDFPTHIEGSWPLRRKNS